MPGRDPPRSRKPGTAPGTPALVVAALCALVMAVYWDVGHLGFVNFDDGEYVFQNPWVLGGLGWRAVAWAFRSFHSSNWHPLTWLSHMLDVELFGLDAGWHHRVSLGWHAATTVLLFAWLHDATGSSWRSGLVAALFAVHPLHVESVAWVAERKDVLCAFFWMLALIAYTRWSRRPSPWRYAAVAAAFAGALLAKPMAVSLPLVLLLVDVWPLGRLRPGAPAGQLWPFLREKLPLLVLSAASSAVTLAAQREAGATQALGAVPWTGRVANAVVSYATYLAKTVWPSDLAVFYPHPVAAGGLAPLTVAASALGLGVVTAAAVAHWRREPALAVGWAWYLVALVPVIGLVQVGSQGMADRYTYLPLVGVFMAVAWALPRPAHRAALAATAAACVGAILALSVAARVQVGVWRSTFTLFRHAAEVTANNWVAWKNVGVEHLRHGQVREAVRALEASVRAWPHDPAAWEDLAAAHSGAGDHAAAAAALRRALDLRPDDAERWVLFGMEGHLAGRPEIAEEALARLREFRPEAARQLRSFLEGTPAR